MRKRAVILGPVLALSFLAVFFLWSLRPPQLVFSDRDLQPTRIRLPAQSNGFPLLLQAGRALALSQQQEDKVAALGEGDSWDEAGAQQLLKSNQVALELLQKAWLCSQLYDADWTNSSAQLSDLRLWRQLANLELVEARLMFHRADEPQAFQNVMQVLQFGQSIEDSGGGTLRYLVGSAIKACALRCLGQFADTTRLPAGSLVSIARQLGHFEASQTALREALKVDYVSQARTLDQFSSVTNANGKVITTPHFIYSVIKSKAELAEQIRHTMAALTNTYSTGIKEVGPAMTNLSETSTLLLLLRGNALGKILNEMNMSSWDKLLARKCRENVALRATRVVLALRAFQIANGRQARSLQELVPDFLEAVPLDDFDGKPLRYIRDAKLVYSVGENLTEDGAMQITNKFHSTAFRFPF